MVRGSEMTEADNLRYFALSSFEVLKLILNEGTNYARYVKFNITRDFTFNEALKFCEISRRLADFTGVLIFMNGCKKNH